MTIAAILDSISQHRFATYQSSVFNGATPEECLGIYLWNKQLAGAFLPALQVIEVSLRNAICGSSIQCVDFSVKSPILDVGIEWLKLM